MNKRNIIIISSVLGLFFLGLIGYFILNKTSESADTDISPSPSSSSMPLASDGPIFSPTPGEIGDVINNICPSSWVGMDSDGDSLPDSVEAIYKTDRANPDSDSDGYKDGDEIKNGYDPMSPGTVRLDSDNDGLLDNEECTWKTNPLNPDTDGDTFKDGAEIKNGYDPTIKGDGSGNDKIGNIPPTPTPSGGLILGTPVPTPENTTTPVNASLEMIKRSELKISSNNSAAAVKTYLASISEASPTDLITGSQIPDALTAAFKGDASELLLIIARLKQHEQKIIAISTPETAVTHQTLLVSLIRFVNQQLNVIATTAGKDAAQQYNAALELQKKLSANIGLLATERQKLEALAK